MSNSLLDAVKTVLILLLRSVDVAEHCPLSEALLFLLVLSAHTVLLFLGPSFSQCPLQASFNVAIPQLLSSASISSTHMSFLQGLSPTSVDQITICCSDSQTSSLDLFPSLQSTTFTCLLECLSLSTYQKMNTIFSFKTFKPPVFLIFSNRAIIQARNQSLIPFPFVLYLHCQFLSPKHLPGNILNFSAY